MKYEYELKLFFGYLLAVLAVAFLENLIVRITNL